MAFLRVIRDKRGYETSYLMHWYREGGRQRSKILYVFRTPGDVRVGRGALEPDIKRQLEGQYPSIAFDWTAVRESRQVIEAAPDLRRRRPRREEREPAAGPPRPADTSAPARLETGRTAASPPQMALPLRMEGTTADEQIGFLTTWYPVIRERIALRTLEPSRQEALLALAERLNPATWTDADQITTGLQEATHALERLAHVFAKRRRRGRKRPEESRRGGGDGEVPVPHQP